MMLSHPVFPFPCRKLYALSIASGLSLCFSSFFLSCSPCPLYDDLGRYLELLVIFVFSFAGCLPPLLPLWCGAYPTLMRWCILHCCSTWYWCTLSFDFLFFLWEYICVCFSPPVLLHPLGCGAGRGMPGRREPGTEPSGVVGGCGKRSPFSFYFILIGLLDALSRLVR